MAKVFSIDGNTISYGGFLLRELGNGSLTISKTVSGSGFDPAKTFEITVVFSAPVTYNGATSTTHTFNLAHGQSVTITDIPELTEYEVTETPLSQADLDAGYREGETAHTTGKVGESGAVSIGIINKYMTPLPEKTMRLKFGNTSYNPTTDETVSVHTGWTQVSSEPNIWDFTYNNTSWVDIFKLSGIPSDDGTGGIWILGANLTGVTSISGLFYYRPSVKQIGIMHTPDLRNMSHAFYTCSLKDGIEWFNTSSVNQMDYAFNGNEATYFPLLDTHNVVNMSFAFSGFRGTKFPDIDTSSARYMEHMFGACPNLLKAPNLDTSLVTTMKTMFMDCYSLVETPTYNAPNVTDSSSMFSSCTNLKKINPITIPSASEINNMFWNCVKVEEGSLDMYNYLSTLNVTNHYHTFTNCGKDTVTGAAELAQIPSSWGGTGA